MSDGKRQYSGALRMHKLINETLLHLAWTEFIPWLQVSYPADGPDVEKAIQCISIASESLDQKTLDAVLSNSSVSQVLQFFEHFLNRYRLRDDNPCD